MTTITFAACNSWVPSCLCYHHAVLLTLGKSLNGMMNVTSSFQVMVKLSWVLNSVVRALWIISEPWWMDNSTVSRFLGESNGKFSTLTSFRLQKKEQNWNNWKIVGNKIVIHACSLLESFALGVLPEWGSLSPVGVAHIHLEGGLVAVGVQGQPLYGGYRVYIVLSLIEKLKLTLMSNGSYSRGDGFIRIDIWMASFFVMQL